MRRRQLAPTDVFIQDEFPWKKASQVSLLKVLLFGKESSLHHGNSQTIILFRRYVKVPTETP